MGIDNNALQFLTGAKRAGVSFQRTATLGRQSFYPEPPDLRKSCEFLQIDPAAALPLASPGAFAEPFFRLLGAEEVSAIDNSDYEGAPIVMDMNAPIDSALKDRFTAIFDGGCLEHVFNFPQAIRNCMEMLAVGGHFIGITPANNFCGHGFYQFSPELFFRVFSAQNGFAIRALLTREKERWFRVIDPEVFGGRVELQNNRPTYLFILAEKMEPRDIFRHPPQQSDYARQWKQEGGTSRSAHPQPARNFLRALLSSGWKEKLRPFAANFSIRHRYPCYQPIAEQSILRGEF